MKMYIEPVYPKLNVKELKYVQQPYIHVIEDDGSRIRVQGDSWHDARRKFVLKQWERQHIAELERSK